MLCGKCSRNVGEQFIEALGKVWHVDCFRCGKCNLQIGPSKFSSEGGVPFHQECLSNIRGDVCHRCNRPVTNSVLEAMGKKWHPDCFTCAECRQQIGTAQFTVKGDQPYHMHCNRASSGTGCNRPPSFNSGETCSQCRTPLAGEIMNALGRKWHPRCFRCVECQQPIPAGTEFTTKGDAPCHAHCERRGAPGGSAPSGGGGGGGAYTPGSWKPFSASTPGYTPASTPGYTPSFSNSGASAEVCGGCYQPIRDGAIVTALGKSWHPHCFRCGKCNDPIRDTQFRVEGNKAFHPACKVISESTKMCQGCYKPIESEILTAMGGTWHPNCFRCGVCGQSIGAGQFTTENNKPVHSHCSKPSTCTYSSGPIKAYEKTTTRIGAPTERTTTTTRVSAPMEVSGSSNLDIERILREAGVGQPGVRTTVTTSGPQTRTFTVGGSGGSIDNLLRQSGGGQPSVQTYSTTQRFTR